MVSGRTPGIRFEVPFFSEPQKAAVEEEGKPKTFHLWLLVFALLALALWSLNEIFVWWVF